MKFGTGVLTDSRKQPDPAQLEQLVAQIAAQRQAGREIVIVTSGAVGAGMGALGLEKRPTELAALSACAAVGQSQLMATYAELFTRHGLRVAQVLLTHEDFGGEKPHVIGTGGFARMLEGEHLFDEVVPELVLLGLKYADALNRDATPKT